MACLSCGGKDVIATFYVSNCLFSYFWNCLNLSQPGVTRFICVKCSQTRQLSSHRLFLNQASVRQHIAHSKPYFEAQLGFRSSVRFKSRLWQGMSWPVAAALRDRRCRFVINHKVHRQGVRQKHTIYTKPFAEINTSIVVCHGTLQ